MTRLLLLFLVFIVLSCQDDDKLLSCDVENPVEEIDWLRDELENYQTETTYSDTFVYQATYGSITVFYISLCCPTCDVMPPEVRTCSGKSLGRLGGEINQDDLKNATIIWRTQNGVCP